jgi:hypothetical protein
MEFPCSVPCLLLYKTYTVWCFIALYGTKFVVCLYKLMTTLWVFYLKTYVILASQIVFNVMLLQKSVKFYIN